MQNQYSHIFYVGKYSAPLNFHLQGLYMGWLPYFNSRPAWGCSRIFGGKDAYCFYHDKRESTHD
jgi:hypothetical protein